MRLKSLLMLSVVVLFAGLLFAPVSTVHAAKRLVLVEESTQWNCPPCATMAPILEDWGKKNSSKAIVVRYHGDGPGANNDPMHLLDVSTIGHRFPYYAGGTPPLYYTVGGEPTTIFDGQEGSLYISGVYTSTAYNYQKLDEFLATRQAVATPLSLDVKETSSNGTVTVTVTATSTAALSGNYRLRCDIVQNIVDDKGAGTNGESEFPNVVLRMLPDQNGLDFSIGANQTKTYTFTYSEGSVWDISRTFAVCFVQNDATKEVINAGTDAVNIDVATRGSSMIVGAPGSTSTFTAVARNSSLSPIDVTATLDAGLLPLNWEATYSIKGTSYSDAHTFTVAPGDSTVISVNVKMTGGNGVCTPSLTLKPAGKASSTGVAVVKFASVSNDLKTIVVDANAGHGRELIYQTLLNDMQRANGVILSDYTSDLITADAGLSTIIYVAGQNVPTDAEISSLTAFLNRGGKLLLTGDVVGTIFSLTGSTAGQLFMQNMLHINTLKETGAWRGFTGVSEPSGIGKGISCGIRTIFNGASDGIRYLPDGIKPRDTKASTFGKFTNVDTACAVAVTGTGYKAVYLTFPIEGMDDPNSQSLMLTRILAWFDAAAAKAVQITSPTTQTVWQQGSVQQITWNATGVATVKISYSIDGTNYSIIVPSFDATRGAYNWTIPSIQSTTAYVKVEDASTGNPVATAGPFTINDQSGVDEHAIVADFRISQNYPNPFATSTQFMFDLPRAERVALKVYDLKGALVATVFDENRQSGAQTASFDASSLPNGTYEYRMITPTGTVSRTMTLVKQ